MSLDATAQAPDGERLAKNSIGLLHIVFFVVAAAAPLTAVVGATPVAFAFGNGAGVPGAFVLAGLLYLLFSVGFTAMSRHVGGAGAFYTYIAQGIGRPAGIGGALIALMTYTAVQCAVYALFGVFFSGTMAGLGIDLPWFVWSLLAVGLVHLAGQRNIAFSGRILGVVMIAEVLILLLLNLAIVLQGGGPEGMSASSFAPEVVFTPGLAVALVFVVGSFIGFESTAIFGEEAKDPDRTIPRATYVAVLLITVFYAFSTWAVVQFYGPSNIQAAAAAEGGLESLYFVAAEQALGGWSVTLMNILLLLSLFACVLSFHNTLNRYFFALGREGLLPHSLGRVHATHGSPARAGVAQSLTAAALLIAFTLGGADPYKVVFSWMSGLAVLGILAVQIMVSVAIILYFKRTHGTEHSALVTVVAPVLALVGLVGAFLLVSMNTDLLTGSDHVLVQAYPLLIVLVGLCGPLLARSIQSRKPELYNNLGRVFE
ncbi:APC family permease [Pseudotabrizicola alkalilacus]|uniref:APC family permease n=1 Tax=Pseudotabrizicola alkalilacus TaxID=2305252 RepID=A0A411Z2Z6_9RHOB|nr:APC family permease [Pseudotabrizicola alkalilacus]RGP37451.1 APC family permease [Pseudotabrizicola alkalilacus]